MMRKRIPVTFLIALLLLICGQLSAQVGINNDGSQPDPSAGLDIKFTDRGLLPPRMTHTQKMAIPDPANGLIVFCTDCDTTGVLQIFVNGSWNTLIHSGGTATNPGSSLVTTAAVTGVSQNFAFSGGYVADDGGYSVTERGVCWNTLPNPTATGSHSSDGAGIGTFSSTVTGLLPGTSYYLRAYATNITGTAYGDAYHFTTLSGNLPAITTMPVSGITQSAAVSGGNVTSAGGSQIYFRGVCWGTSPSPTTSNSHTTDGSGTGAFTSTLTGLDTNHFYYVRAYAMNSAGVGYGNQVIFSTYHVGQAYGGGVIFYIDNTAARLYISAPSDQSTGATWGCPGTGISGLSALLGTGPANTTAILNGCSSPGIAARICDQLVLNGYSDWFLPSLNEMNQLYFQKSSVGGFTTGRYWISNQFDAAQAYVKDFSGASASVFPKDASYFVRAIRME